MLLLLDIDGTVCETLSGERFGKHFKDYKLMPNVLQALEKLPPLTKIIGISNQEDVDHGYKTLEDCKEEQLYKLHLLPVMSAIYFCPDIAGKSFFKVTRDNFTNGVPEKLREYFADNFFEAWRGQYLKPNPGMIEAAIAWDAPTIHKKKVWMVGDRDEDCEAARKAAINFCWAHHWRRGEVQILPSGSAII